LGFPQAPGQMTGATAIIGEPLLASVRAYSLNAKAVSAVMPLDEGQQQLRDVSISIADGGVTMEFTVTLGEAGVPADLSVADIIYASGPQPTLSYHGGTRGGTVVRFQARAPQADVGGLVGGLGQALGQSVGEEAAGGGGGSVSVLTASIVSFLVGAFVVVAVLLLVRRNTLAFGGYKPGVVEGRDGGVKRFNVEVEAAIEATSSSTVRAAPTPPAEYPPLPEGWEEHLDEGTRRMFYAHTETGEVVWVRPHK